MYRLITIFAVQVFRQYRHKPRDINTAAWLIMMVKVYILLLKSLRNMRLETCISFVGVTFQRPIVTGPSFSKRHLVIPHDHPAVDRTKSYRQYITVRQIDIDDQSN